MYYTYNGENLAGIKDFNCYSSEPRLHDCAYSNYRHYFGAGAGVRCRAFENINIVTINNLVFVTWEYSNSTTSHRPSSFDVRCISEGNYTRFSASDGTFRVNVGGLLPPASYSCCVSARYGTDIAEISCASLTVGTEDIDLFSTINSGTNMHMRANLFIIQLVEC